MFYADDNISKIGHLHAGFHISSPSYNIRPCPVDSLSLLNHCEEEDGIIAKPSHDDTNDVSTLCKTPSKPPSKNVKQRWKTACDKPAYELLLKLCHTNNLKITEIFSSKSLNSQYLSIFKQLRDRLKWKQTPKILYQRMYKLYHNQKLSYRQNRMFKKIVKSHIKIHGCVKYDEVQKELPGKTVEGLVMAHEEIFV